MVENPKALKHPERPKALRSWFVGFVGFYCADTVSLSFGALSVNDVVAAAVTVAFCEVVSVIYYSVNPPPPSPTHPPKCSDTSGAL